MSKNLINALLSNRGFAYASISSDTIPAEELKEWHALLDNLLSESYKYNSETHNNAIMNVDNSLSSFNNHMVIINMDSLYDVLRNVVSYINQDSDIKIKVTQNLAQTLISKSATVGNKKSVELQFVYSQKSNASRYLKQLEAINGSSEETKNSLRNEIGVYDAKINELKSVPDNLFKELKRVPKNVWYKTVEDLFADCITKRMAMTAEEVEAEAEAIKAARKLHKKSKKQAEKVLVK